MLMKLRSSGGCNRNLISFHVQVSESPELSTMQLSCKGDYILCWSGPHTRNYACYH